jgi:hypothetical protein
MASYSFLVFTKPAPGRDEEFNRWYTGTHLPDMLKVEGFVLGQRFRILRSQPVLGSPSWEYVAIYSIETADIGRVMKSLNARLGTADLPMSDCIDIQNLHGFLAEPVTGVVRAG